MRPPLHEIREVDLLNDRVIDCQDLFHSPYPTDSSPPSGGSPAAEDAANNADNVGQNSPLIRVDSSRSMQGLSGLSEVVARLERRFACGVIPELESSGDEQTGDKNHDKNEAHPEFISDAAGVQRGVGVKAKKKRKRARKATKEEQQWLEEGRGFLDDAEAVDDVNRHEAERNYSLKYSGFYVYRGSLSALMEEVEEEEEKAGGGKGKGKKKRKRVFSDTGQERVENAQEKLPYAVTKPLQRVKDVLGRLEDVGTALAGGFPPEVDHALAILERTMRKNVENHTEDMRYLSLLMELLPLDEELVYSNMERIRLQMRCKWLTNSYNKSMTELRKVVKVILDALPDVDKQKFKGNAVQWNEILESVFATSALVDLKPSEEVAQALQRLYSMSFTSKEKKVKAKAKAKSKSKSKAKGKRKEKEQTWETALSKLDRVASKLEARAEERSENSDEAKKKSLKSAREICALVRGLLLRTSEKKKPFKWDADSKKLLRQVGLTHRKIAIQTVKLRNLELQTGGKIKSWCRSRDSMLKHVCDVWPARYMQPAEVNAITLGSTSRLPVDSKLAPPQCTLEAASSNGSDKGSNAQLENKGMPSHAIGNTPKKKKRSKSSASNSGSKRSPKKSPQGKKRASGKTSKKKTPTKRAKKGSPKKGLGEKKSPVSKKLKSSDLFKTSVFDDDTSHAAAHKEEPKRGLHFDELDLDKEWNASDFPVFLPPSPR